MERGSEHVFGTLLEIYSVLWKKLKHTYGLVFFVPAFFHSFNPIMLLFQTTPSNLVITGNTFPVKHILKSVGANWNVTQKAWLAPLAIDGEVLRCSLRNCEILSGKEPGEKENDRDLSFWTEHVKNMAKRAVVFKKSMGLLDTDFWWICCEYCTIKDWHRQRVTCPCHGK